MNLKLHLMVAVLITTMFVVSSKHKKKLKWKSCSSCKSENHETSIAWQPVPEPEKPTTTTPTNASLSVASMNITTPTNASLSVVSLNITIPTNASLSVTSLNITSPSATAANGTVTTPYYDPTLLPPQVVQQRELQGGQLTVPPA